MHEIQTIKPGNSCAFRALIGTFTAILLGTVVAALLAEYFRGHHTWPGFMLVLLALAGLAAAKRFRANFIGDQPLALAVMANTYFSFLGSLLLLNLLSYGADTLDVDGLGIGKLNVALAAGIGLGSLLAVFFSRGKIECALTVVGALGMAAMCLALAAPGLSLHSTMGLLMLLGLAGGFFIVPVCALLQQRPDRENKGGTLVAANLLSYVGVFLAAGAHHVLAAVWQWSPRAIFFAGGVLTLLGVVMVMVMVRYVWWRVFFWLALNTIYRIRVEGREHIPERGGGLIVCNHPSFADPFLVMISMSRRARFLINRWTNQEFFWRTMSAMSGSIPVSERQGPRELLKSLQVAADAIRAGQLVFVFPEGTVWPGPEMKKFHAGFERIMKNVDAPIIPVALVGMQDSIFSFEWGKYTPKWPRHFPYPMTVRFGKPMPASSTTAQVRAAVEKLLSADCAD